MNDRLIGYTVIITVICLLILPVGFIICQSSQPRTVRTISFNNVPGLSFLAVQDPVRMLGVEIGLVTGIESSARSTVVTIKTNATLIIHEGYTIFVNPKGVMGDQYLMILPGDSLGPIVPPDRMLFGVPSIGPDEALAYIDKLRETVHSLNVHIRGLSETTAGKQSFVTHVWQTANAIDTIANEVLSTLVQIDTVLQHNFTKSIIAIDKSRLYTTRLTDSLSVVLLPINNVLLLTDSLLSHVDLFLKQSNAMVNKINDSEMLSWKDYSETITERLAKLHSLINGIRSDTLTLPIRLW